jgi:hypothetical protein
MLVFGLILIVLGVLALLAGLFTAGDTGDASLLGIHLGATTVFLVGVFAGVAVLWGFTITKFGTRRELQHRRDQRRLRELSEKLDRVDADRQREDGDDRPEQ